MTTEGSQSVGEQKAALRRRAIAAIATCTREHARIASEQVCGSLLSVLSGRPGPVLSFAAMRDPERGVEVDLGPLHQSLIRSGRLALPQMDWENRTMRALVLPPAPALDDSMLRVHRYSVPEPALGEPVEASTLGTILIPGLCFDRSGRRLGRGAGYYDRFLGEIPTPSTPDLIGVCFDVQMVDRVPTEPHDQRVGRVVTESSLVVCDR